MKIALDWDETFTKDPHFWKIFFEAATYVGHEVFIVTMRYPSEPITQFAYPHLIYYTSRAAKKPFMERNGIKIDIWIDDRPEFILNHAGDYRGTTKPTG